MLGQVLESHVKSTPAGTKDSRGTLFDCRPEKKNTFDSAGSMVLLVDSSSIPHV